MVAAEPAPGSVHPGGPPTCFGFSLRSSMSFAYARGGNGSGVPLEVVERPDRPTPGRLLQEWPAIPRRRSRTRLYTRDDALFVEVGRAHWFAVTAGTPRIEASPTPDPAHRERLMWTTPAAALIAARRDLALHASAVEIDGRAVLVVATSGRGKTTTAAALAAAGHRLLADDLACCRMDPTPVLLPGPALLRLRSDAARRLRIPGTYVVTEDPDRVTLGFEPAARGDGGPIELGGIVFLIEARADDVTARDIQASEAIRLLWRQNFHLPGEDEVARCFEALTGLASRVPVRAVSRRRVWSSLPDVVSAIETLARP